MAGETEERTEVKKVEEKTPGEAPEPTPKPSPTPQPEPEETGGYITVTQFRKYFGVSDTYVRSLIKAGKVRGLRTIGGRYRIPKSELARFEKDMICEPRASGDLPPRKRKEASHGKEEAGKSTRQADKGSARDDEEGEDEDEFDE